MMHSNTSYKANEVRSHVKEQSANAIRLNAISSTCDCAHHSRDTISHPRLHLFDDSMSSGELGDNKIYDLAVKDLEHT